MQSSDKKEEKKEMKTYALDEDISLTTTASAVCVCSHFESDKDTKDIGFFKNTICGIDSVTKAIKEDVVEFVEKEEGVFLKLTWKGEKIRKKFER